MANTRPAEFPVDDVTLSILESACRGEGEEQSHLFAVLEIPPDESKPCGCVRLDSRTIDCTGCERHLAPWTPHDVILSLITELRRWRDGGPPPEPCAHRIGVRCIDCGQRP